MAPFHSTRFKSPRDWTNIFVYWKILIPVSQFWGLFSAVVLIAIGVHESFMNSSLHGIYILFTSFGVMGLESHWLLNKINSSKENEETSTCVNLVASFQHPWNLWKKSIIYWIASLLLFTKSKSSVLYDWSGIQLLVLSAVYLLMFIQHELRVHLLQMRSFRGTTNLLDRIARHPSHGEEMEVFQRIQEESEEEIEDNEEDDPALVEILDVDEDPMLIM